MPNTYDDDPLLENDALLEAGQSQEPKKKNETRQKSHFAKFALNSLILFNGAVAVQEKPLVGYLSGAFALNVVFDILHLLNENEVSENPRTST